MLLRLVVLLLPVEDDADLIVHEGVGVAADPLRLRETQQRRPQVVRPQILHTDVQGGRVAAREEPRRRPVGRHRLVRLVLGREGVPKSYPACRKVLVQSIGFVEVLPCKVVFLNEEVVRADSKPGHREVRVGRHELVGDVVNLADLVELNEDSTVEGHDVHIVEVGLHHSLDDLIGAQVVLLVEESLSLDEAEVEAADADLSRTLLERFQDTNLHAVVILGRSPWGRGPLQDQSSMR